jgi:hypothetical protein
MHSDIPTYSISDITHLRIHDSLTTVLSDPTYTTPLLLSLLFQPLLYTSCILLFPSLFPTKKQRGWILTAANSAALSLASIPYLVEFFVKGATELDEAPFLIWDAWSRPVCAYFVSYLIGDLVLGTLLYPSEVHTHTLSLSYANFS